MAKKRPAGDYELALYLHRAMGWSWRVIGRNFGVTRERARQMAARGQRLQRPEYTYAALSAIAYRRRVGRGDLTWQWRGWNEWVATPMIGRNDNNTMLAAL